MTLSNTLTRNNYTGTGAAQTFTYAFPITDQSHLVVTVRNTSGVETTLTITTDYTVTGVGATAGGTIVLVDDSQAWLTGGYLTTSYILTIRRVVPLTQALSIRNQSAYYPENIEAQLDKMTQLLQQHEETLARCLKIAPTEIGSTGATIVPVASLRLSKTLGFDASGDIELT